MKKFYFFVSTFIFSLVAYSQNPEICGTMPNLDRLVRSDKSLEIRRADYESFIQSWIASHPNQNSSKATITIPVVVHVVWRTAAQNISDNQVKSQIIVLNEDFGRTNQDTSQTPAPWRSVAVNTGVQFCLAQRDPFGNPSTGIERRQTIVTAFSTNDAVKYYSQGGMDIWDPSRYINIWVCSFGNTGLLGYGEFPTGTLTNTFGAVIDNTVFGSSFTTYGTFPTLLTGYNRGRTTTHEFSHCFNLYHIWGDDGSACTGSDFCADTPNQGPATNGCFTFPHLDACAGSPAPNAGDPVNGIMYMNYMDYSSDVCKNLFTNNQSARINAVLSNMPYSSLAASNGCVPVILQVNDAGHPAFVLPSNSGNVCSTTFAPIVVLKNWGTATLASCTINYKLDANPVNTYSWTGSLASLATSNVTLPSLTTTLGTHTLVSYPTNPNGMPDGNPNNDTARVTFTVVGVGANLPFSEGFEAPLFPPSGWTRYNPDNGITWQRSTVAAKTGVASAYMNNFAYACNGCIDELITPNLNLTSVATPGLSFQVAYRMQTNPALNPNYSDTLEVDISTDCGATWNRIYKKFGTALTTIIPTYSATPYIPGAANWRQEIISLAPYALSTNAAIKFKHTTDFENRMYIDDVNIAGNVGIQSLYNPESISIYPNPNSGLFYIDTKLSEVQNLKIIIYDVVGKEEGRITIPHSSGGVVTVDLSDKVNGIYFIETEINNQKITRKIIIHK